MCFQGKTELVELQKVEIEAVTNGSLQNVMTVLTRAEPSGSADEGQLLQALQDKYDALQDKLLTDSLIKQVGEAEWNKLNEQERMAKLVQLKLEARRLRQEGQRTVYL